MAVAEHRSIPSKARSVNHQLRKAGHHSVWSPAYQDQVAGGHAGVGVVPPDVVLALRDAVSRSCADDFWTVWSKSAEPSLFRAYCWAGGPTAAGSSAFIGRGLLRIRSRRLGGRGASRRYRISQVMMLMSSLLSTLSTLPLLQSSSFVGVLSLLLMCLR